MSTSVAWRDNEKAKSIRLGDNSDDEELNDVQWKEKEDEMRLESERQKEVSYWNISEQTQAHAMQMMLKLGGNLGTYINGKFKKGVFARKNIDGIREYISHKDDKESRELLILIFTLNLMPKYIVPLFEASEDDTEVMIPLLRLFLALTRGLKEEKQRAASSRVREKQLGKEDKTEYLSRVKREKEYRENALKQISALMSFKESIVSEKVFHVIYQYTDGPISKPPKARSPDDQKSIEAVLFLLSNLLQIRVDPFSTSPEQIRSRSLQNKLILVLESSNFFDLFLLLCTTINAKGNNQWNSIMVEILHCLFLGRKMNEVAFSRLNQTLSAIDYEAKLNKKEEQCRLSDAGKLKQQLHNERLGRLNSARNTIDQRLNRYGGIIRRVTGSRPEPNDASNHSYQASAAPVLLRSLSTQRNTGSTTTVSSKINCTTLGGGAKKVRKKCCFAEPSQDAASMALEGSDALRSSSCVNIVEATIKSSVGGLGKEERAVNVALSKFLDSFLENGFSELVYSMKESWRRGDANTPRTDSFFFKFTTACLQYEKQVVRHDHKQAMARRAKLDESEPWVPDLKKITECFDRMMINRPSETIKSHFDKVKGARSINHDDVLVPMLLYKETISFIGIMLESEETAHNDIAVTALYRIFFNPSSSDRMDVLPMLLKNWNPRLYSKSFMFSLVELTHVTLTVLGVASNYFANNGGPMDATEKKAAKAKKSKATDGREAFISAGSNFDHEDYFQRIASLSNTVRLFTKALEFYRENSKETNSYIFFFFKRMFNHELERDDDPYSLLTTKEKREPLTLCNMLFNMSTLNIFSIVLNDEESIANLEPLIKLIKCVVRRFGELASRNRMLFVETLLHQPFPIKHLRDIDSTYNAAGLAGNYRRTLPSYDVQDGEDSAAAAAAIVYSSESEADVEEFSELTRPVSKPKQRPKKSNLRSRIEKKRSRKRKMEDSDEEDSDDISSSEISDLKQGASNSPVQSSRRRRTQWTSEEDDVLRDLYKLYAGSHSVFSTIAQDPSLVELSGNKTAQMVERRVQQLELHLLLANASSDDSDKDMDAIVSPKRSADASTEEAADFKAPKRKRSKCEASEDESTSENELLESSMVSLKSPAADSTTGATASIDIDETSSKIDQNGSAFWEDDSESESGFDGRMKAMATRSLQRDGESRGAPKPKKILKKNGKNENISDSSDNDIDDGEETSTRVHKSRSSLLVDSDED